MNNRHPVARQRYTVGHEIGHHVLGHATSLDVETELDQATAGSAPEQERMAEAFAAWLLMPRRLVQRRIEELRLDPATPMGVYQLALAVGSSYSAIVRQLANLRAIDHATTVALLKVAPASIKQLTMGEPAVGIGAADVHSVRPPLEDSLTVGTGDLVVIHLPDVVREIDVAGLGELVDTAREASGTRVRLRVRSMASLNPSAPAPVHPVKIDLESDEVVLPITLEPPRQGVPEVWF